MSLFSSILLKLDDVSLSHNNKAKCDCKSCRAVKSEPAVLAIFYSSNQDNKMAIDL